MSALRDFCQEVVEDLEAGQLVSDEAFGFPSIDIIIQLVTSIITAIRTCRQPPAPAGSTLTEGARLHDIAVRAWNEQTADYDGWEYKNAVRQALKASTERARRDRKRDAVRTVTSLFNRARRSNPLILEAVAADTRPV